jgi:hypothetical protein
VHEVLREKKHVGSKEMAALKIAAQSPRVRAARTPPFSHGERKMADANLYSMGGNKRSFSASQRRAAASSAVRPTPLL